MRPYMAHGAGAPKGSGRPARGLRVRPPARAGGPEPRDAPRAAMRSWCPLTSWLRWARRWPLDRTARIDSREGHAEQVRACVLHACSHAVRRPAHPDRRQPGRGHSGRHRGRGGRRLDLLSPGRVLLGDGRHHAVRLLRPRRRQHGAAAGPLQPLGGLSRLHPRPGRRLGDLRRARPVVRGPGRQPGALRHGDLLPRQRPGGLVHQGARRGHRAAGGRQRPGGARRAAGHHAGRLRPVGPARLRGAGSRDPAADRPVGRRHRQRGHPGPARGNGTTGVGRGRRHGTRGNSA